MDLRHPVQTLEWALMQDDGCVYVATQILYRIAQPNRRFFLDVAAQQMRAKGEKDRYEGRDTKDDEAFDFEVAGTLARLREVVRHGEPDDGTRIARVLAGVAEEMKVADSGGWTYSDNSVDGAEHRG